MYSSRRVRALYETSIPDPRYGINEYVSDTGRYASSFSEYRKKR